MKGLSIRLPFSLVRDERGASIVELALFAPFLGTLMLTRGSRDWVRIIALVVGAALLVPWPFVVAGGGGAL